MLFAVEEERLAAFDDPPAEPASSWQGRLGFVLAVLDVVPEFDGIRIRVEERDVGDVSLKDVADLVADQVDQPREVELPRDRLADVVDGSELSRPLIGFGQ